MKRREKSSFVVLLERESQESKITSTPRTMSPVLSYSPSVSTIEKEGELMEVDSEPSSDEEMDQSLEASSFDDPISDVSRRRVERVKEVKWPVSYEDVKPKKKDSLFHKIVTQPGEIESIAVDMVNIYNQDEKRGVLLMLQLFVDLCGYKKLVVEKYYVFETLNSKEFVQRMEEELMEPKMIANEKFLFMKSTRFEEQVDKILADFIYILSHKCFQQEILFDEVFTGHLFEFINCMCFSSIRCIFVTGVILAIRFLTAVVRLFSRFEDENGNLQSAMIDNKRSALANIIDFLYILCEKNCLIPDKRSYIVKIKFAQEVYQWVERFPEIFILKRHCMGRLMKMILDNNDRVRYKALATCEKLISNEKILLSERIELCLKFTSTRVVDSNNKVAAKAITVLTEALDRYEKYVTKTYKLGVIYRIFESNSLLAKAAGKFLAKYLHLQNTNSEELLLSLVKVANLRTEFAERLPYLLESCIEFLPELEDWNLMVTILLNHQIGQPMRVCLLRILNESVRFSLTGKFSMMRETVFEERVQDDKVSDNIAAAIIPNFKQLVLTFHKEKKCLNLIIELLVFINRNSVYLDILHDHYEIIFSHLRDIFKISTDQTLIEQVTAAFWGFCQEPQHSNVNAIFDTIKNRYLRTYMDDLKELPSDNRELLLGLREATMKISIIFAKFDLTEVLKWEEIFQVWDHNLRLLKYLLVCCKWHLVWGLRRFIRASMAGDAENLNRFLYSNCKDFVYGCLEILQQATDKPEFFMVFEEFCDLYTCFEKELRRKRDYNNFQIVIEEPNCQEILTGFVERFVINNTKLDLEKRQLYLSKFIGVINLGVIYPEHFSRILAYYHKYYEEFGVMIDRILKELSASHPGLPLLVMHTLAQLYNKILEKYGVVDMLSEESNQLKILARKFAALKEMKSSSVLLKLVNMSICFAVKGRQYYPFLQYTKYFARMLKDDGKSEAYHMFVEMVPKADKNSDIILLFAGILKQST